MVSRQALRSALLPLLIAAAVFFMWQAVRPYAKPQTIQRRWPMISRLVSYVLAGLFLGFSLLTYMAARVLPVVFIAFWVYLFIFHRPIWKANWFGVIFIIGLGLIIAWPMFNYIATTPGAEPARLAAQRPDRSAVCWKSPGTVQQHLRCLGHVYVLRRQLVAIQHSGSPFAGIGSRPAGAGRSRHRSRAVQAHGVHAGSVVADRRDLSQFDHGLSSPAICDRSRRCPWCTSLSRSGWWRLCAAWSA